MRRLIEFLVVASLRALLSLRYRITIKGLKELKAHSKGILFLSNHPAEIDPLILLCSLWHPFKPHPVAIDYLFKYPLVGSLLKIARALPVPNFDAASNSFKRKQMEKTYQHLFACLDRGENILLYPAGGLKNSGEERIGGASGVHTLLERNPTINIALVRMKGLWGSSFSKAPTGKTPELFSALWNGFKILCRNLIFFTPRREVEIEVVLASEDFPRNADRLALNRYLESWYNKEGPEPLKLVSFSFFGSVFPIIKGKTVEERQALEQIPLELRQKVMDEIARLTRIPLATINDESHLAQDLGLDSLDIAQLAVALRENFGIGNIRSTELTTVGSVLAFASKQRVSKSEEQESLLEFKKWNKKADRPQSIYPEGDTIPEVFLKTCARMKEHVACVDLAAQERSYKQLKLGVLLLASYIKKLPGERIGIMLPASVAVNALILATQFAGKVPVMINWTLGERNLRSVVQQSGIEVVLSSWQFIDRLDGVELNGIDEKIELLEEIRTSFSLKDKMSALFLSRKKTCQLMNHFHLDRLSKDATAVILFTSGTESFPKAVPLSHHNILSDQRGAYTLAHLSRDDILLGALPPFHSFGFSVTGLLPLLTGIRVAYSPNPTDGKRMAEAIARWKVTLLCLAPTFLKNLLRVATEKQLRSLQLVVTGAEKTADELYQKLAELNSQALLIEGYGITECAPILTLNPPKAERFGVGIPIPGVELKIVHPETYEPLDIGEQGLILASGPNVFAGYLDQSLHSPFVELEGKKWYQTGDLGFLNQSHYLTLSGRLKRFVKIGGEMVSLASIEETLALAASKKGWNLDPELPSFAVCALEVDGKKSEVHLFTIFDTSTEEVNQILREGGMSNIIKIRSVKKLPFIPLLATGKIDYRKLIAKLSDQS